MFSPQPLHSTRCLLSIVYCLLSLFQQVIPFLEPSLLHLLGYFCSILIGFTLGTIGAGGSILTVPVLVYLMSVSPVMATSYSLFVVGTTSLMGTWRYTRKSLVDFRTVLIFGVPSIVTVYLIRLFLIPVIPEILFTWGSLVVTRDKFLMLIFAIAMLIAGQSMLRKKNLDKAQAQTNYLVVFLAAVCVGLVTGMVGIGGGFIIVPALVLFAGVSIRYAIGTSLFIIALNSFAGFAGEVQQFSVINWNFLIVFSLFSIAGIIAGEAVAQKLSSARLKALFGWFIIVLGFIIAVIELEVL